MTTSENNEPKGRSLDLRRGEFVEVRSAQEILATRKAVTEGAESAPAVVELAERLSVDLPICKTVLALIQGELDARSAVDQLLNRPLKQE